MRRGLLAGALLLGAMAQAPAPDALARARSAYNAREYDAAIAAAREARRVPTPTLPVPRVLGTGRGGAGRYRRYVPDGTSAKV